MPVDVVVKMNDAILGHDRSAVHNQDRDGTREIHLLRRASVHRGANAIHVPARIIAQDPDCHVGGPFQTDAAVAEIAAGLRKEDLLGSVVHVHVVVVGKDKFHESQ